MVKIKAIIWIQRQNFGSVSASKQAFSELQVFLEIVQKRSISALRTSGILARPPQRVGLGPGFMVMVSGALMTSAISNRYFYYL